MTHRAVSTLVSNGGVKPGQPGSHGAGDGGCIADQPLARGGFDPKETRGKSNTILENASFISFQNTRRDIDEKVEQLRAISQLAALIAGFDIVVLIGKDDEGCDVLFWQGWLNEGFSAELDIPANVPETLLVALGISSALTVCLMSLSFVLCTLMLVGILKAFDINSHRRQTFREFWILRCEDDWRKAFKVRD